MHPLYRKADKLSHLAIGSAIEVHRLKGPGLRESTHSFLRMHWAHEPWKVPASRTHSKRFAKSQALGYCAAAFGVRGACSRFRTRFMGSIYERCLMRELELRHVAAVNQRLVGIEYKGLVSDAVSEEFRRAPLHAAGQFLLWPGGKAPGSLSRIEKNCRYRNCGCTGDFRDRSSDPAQPRPALPGQAGRLLGRATAARQWQGAAGPAKNRSRFRAGPRRRGEPKKEPVPLPARSV